MKLLVPLALAALLAALAVASVVVFVADLVDHLKHRGEDPVDEHAEEAMQVLAGSDLIDAMVPQGTGERMAREIETWLKESAA